MKKIFILLFVCVSFLSLYAENFVLNDIVITGSKLDNTEHFFNKDQISSEKIQSSSELNQVLNSSLNLDFRNYSSPGSLLTVGADGVSAKHTLKTFDGIKLNSRANGDFDMSLIEPELLGSISILNNSSSSLFGGSASAGVINMNGLNYTEDKLGFKFGLHNYKKSYIKKMLDKSTVFFGSYKEYNGTRTGDAGRQNSFYLKNKREKISTSIYMSEKYKETPGTLTWPTIGNYQDSDLKMAKFDYKINDYFNLKINKIDQSTDFYVSGDNVTNNTSFDTLSYELNYLGKNYILGFSSEKQNYEYDQYIDTNADYINDTWRIGEKEEDETSVYAEFDLNSKLYLGVRKDSYDTFEDKTIYNVSYYLTSGVKVNFGEGYSVPTFNDLYWPEANMPGNPNLKPEESDNISIDLDIKKWNVNLFKNEYKDLINWAPVNPLLPFGPWTPKNIDKAEIKGIEINYDMSEKLDFNYKYTDPEDSNGTTLLNKELTKASLIYKYDNKGEIIVRKVGKKYIAANTPEESVVLLDYNYSYNNTYINISNVFDKKYVVNNNYPEAEREFTFGFEINI